MGMMIITVSETRTGSDTSLRMTTRLKMTRTETMIMALQWVDLCRAG